MNQSKDNTCTLCKIAKHELSAVIVHEDEDVIAILDLYPATSGHILVLPKQHIENVYVMPVKTGRRIMEVALALSRAVKHELSPTGMNLIQSNEAAGGQTINHFHLHIVPRYEHDPVVLKFGHGSKPADNTELERLGALLRAAYKK